ncbi:hypothetical protein BFW01_g6657 [Lasiodiplodia theobromae]|nr:hypothetical protein BFW01_g6657 [Lasiodiplodia theobromae]
MLYMHENILKPSFLGEFVGMKDMLATTIIDVCCTTETLTMIIEYLYTGEYSPTIQDIKLMHPAVQDLEAKRQFGVFDIDGAAE